MVAGRADDARGGSACPGRALIPRQGLLPRSTRPGHDKYEWNYKDAAADCYAHFVVEANLLATDHLPALAEILATEHGPSGSSSKKILATRSRVSIAEHVGLCQARCFALAFFLTSSAAGGCV